MVIHINLDMAVEYTVTHLEKYQVIFLLFRRKEEENSVELVEVFIDDI